MRTALFVRTLLAFSMSLGAACTLTAPDGKDDAVTRCSTVADCPSSPDNRFGYACVRAKDQSEQSKQVCEPRYATVACNFQAATGDIDPSAPPEEGAAYLQFLARVAADLDKDAAALCPDDKLGKLGCPPKEDGSCDEGEVVTVGQVKFCSDPKALTIPAGGDPNLVDADIRDQFCRWYFCDDQVVCSSGQCKPCDPDATFENGGCRTMYRQGAVSPAHKDVSQICNQDGRETATDLSPADEVFGDFPPASAPSL